MVRRHRIWVGSVSNVNKKIWGGVLRVPPRIL